MGSDQKETFGWLDKGEHRSIVCWTADLPREVHHQRTVSRYRGESDDRWTTDRSSLSGRGLNTRRTAPWWPNSKGHRCLQALRSCAVQFLLRPVWPMWLVSFPLPAGPLPETFLPADFLLSAALPAAGPTPRTTTRDRFRSGSA
jgi:hypothetical protein